jgi:hypothetical protein
MWAGAGRRLARSAPEHLKEGGVPAWKVGDGVRQAGWRSRATDSQWSTPARHGSGKRGQRRDRGTADHDRQAHGSGLAHVVGGDARMRHGDRGP